MAMEALKKIAEASQQKAPQEDEQEEVVPKTKWLFFYIGQKKYAVCESQVVNILKDAKLYNFPFAPLFVAGIINNHNKICAAIDYYKLTGQASDEFEFNLYIVLRTNADDIAVRVTGVDDFYQVPDESYSSDQGENQEIENLNFIKGNLDLEGEKIPVIDVQAINEVITRSCSKEGL